MEHFCEKLKNKKRIVVKIGTSTLTHQTGIMNIRRTEILIKILSDLKNSGKEIIIVTSGAIGVGCGKIGLNKKPIDTPSKQAIAAIGQCELMYFYDKQFGQYNHTVAQVLMTKDVVTDDVRRENCHNTLTKLLSYNAIPIINENDTVSVEEIEFGDNDTLSAVVATLIDADLLVILSDIDGLYNENPKKNPNASLIKAVNNIDDDILKVAEGAGSELGTGGMLTKIHAAKIATESGIDMMIMNGNKPEKLYNLFDGENVGTLFTAKK